MFKDKTVRALLFGTTAKVDENIRNSRVSTWSYPSSGSTGDFDRKIEYPTADGFILYLIKRIEELEKRIK